jgi:hypothetical protein
MYFHSFFVCFAAFLCCLGYHLPVLLWPVLMVKIFVTSVCSLSMDSVRFLAILPLQLPLNHGGCLYCMGLLTEPFCAALREGWILLFHCLLFIFVYIFVLSFLFKFCR